MTVLGPTHVAGIKEVSDAEVRIALQRILASPDFPAPERRRAFLQFVVEETLAGRGRELKGFTIAHAVFGRDETFDSKADPIVRLEARRLRRDLDCYYVGPGGAEAVRISIPKGGYEPLFERWSEQVEEPPAPNSQPTDAETAPPVRAGPGRRVISAALAVLCLLLLTAAFGAGLIWKDRATVAPPPTQASSDQPQVAVLPFDALDRSEIAETLAAGLASELVFDLGRFDGFRLYAPARGDETAPVMSELRKASVPTYIVRGEVLTQGERVSVTVRLLGGASDEAIWRGSYDLQLSPGALIELRDSLSEEISVALGQPYGALHENVLERAASEDPESLASYLCVQKAYAYRRSFSAAEFAPVLACLNEAVTRSPDYADAWAMLGWLHLDAGRYAFPGAAAPEEEYTLAVDAARQALAIRPNSVLALKALSSIEHYRGHYEESERLARRAVALNPYDPDMLAQLGWRLAVRGRFDEGVPLMREAIERSVDPPGWYFHLLAIDQMMKGDYVAMLREAEHAALTSRPISNALLAIAAAGVGHVETTRTALSRIPTTWDMEVYAREHGATDEIVGTLVEGLAVARDFATDPGIR